MQPHNVGDRFLRSLESCFDTGKFPGLGQHSSTVLGEAQRAYPEARSAVPTGWPFPGVLSADVLS